MVDTLNRQLDSLQIARKPPSWTANVAGGKFGIDGSNIYIGPIRIPTAALALLGNLLPQGDYDEARRGGPPPPPRGGPFAGGGPARAAGPAQKKVEEAGGGGKRRGGG